VLGFLRQPNLRKEQKSGGDALFMWVSENMPKTQTIFAIAGVFVA
jgi:hypothetical protein